jgi:hypothetical protein
MRFLVLNTISIPSNEERDFAFSPERNENDELWGGYLPYQQQRICAIGMLGYDDVLPLPDEKTPLAPGETPVPYFSWQVLVGDEERIVRGAFASETFHSAFFGKKKSSGGTDGWPVIVTADGRGHSFRVLVHRAFELELEERRKLACDGIAVGMDAADIRERRKSLFENSVSAALRVFQYSEDKWEKVRPNYWKRYSEFVYDVRENLGWEPDLPRPKEAERILAMSKRGKEVLAMLTSRALFETFHRRLFQREIMGISHGKEDLLYAMKLGKSRKGGAYVYPDKDEEPYRVALDNPSIEQAWAEIRGSFALTDVAEERHGEENRSLNIGETQVVIDGR